MQKEIFQNVDIYMHIYSFGWDWGLNSGLQILVLPNKYQFINY
jgi:hypothetical protein